MIISASYKTDIPAFFGEWFRNRLRAGFCRMVNSFNRHQHYTVSLRPGEVDGFVFWSKNVGPFLPVLDEVHDRGFGFILHHSVNGYPRALEPKIRDASASIENLRKVAAKFGPKVVVWRYDPIVFSSLTPEDFHRDSFERLARALHGVTDEVVISFVQMYRKTRKNLDLAADGNGFTWTDPTPEFKRSFASGLAQVARGFGMRLTMCSQPELLAPGVGEARCVDAERLMQVSGHRFSAKLKGMRPTCGCYHSKDIGDYETCPHGCVYCYANQTPATALTRFRNHDPKGEYLFPNTPPPPKPGDQLGLLPED